MTTTALSTGDVSADRHPGLDYLRFVAIAEVVAFHAGATGGSLCGGVNALMAVCVAMSLRSRRSFSESAKRRAARLLWPWLAWSGIYAALKVADAIYRGAPIASEFEPSMLLTGSAIHLWFLPFAFVVTIITSQLPERSPGRFGVWLLPLAYALALAGSAYATQLPVPFAQWVSVLPEIVLGLTLGLYLFRGYNPLPFLVCGLIVAGGLSIHPTLGHWGAAVAILACLMIEGGEAVGRWLSRMSFGVYLAHAAVFAILSRWLDDPLIAAVMTLVGSLIVSRLIYAAPTTRRLIEF